MWCSFVGYFEHRTGPQRFISQTKSVNAFCVAVRTKGEELNDWLTVPSSGPKEQCGIERSYCGAGPAPGSPDSADAIRPISSVTRHQSDVENTYRPKTCQELDGAFSGVTVSTVLELLTSHFQVPYPFPSSF
jgi:hypothetical protein